MELHGGARVAKVDQVRRAMLELHRRMIDEQRIRYERLHGRIETTSQFLGLVLEHPDFEWIRALSALVAQLDEWRDAAGEASDRELVAILEALRRLIQRDGPNTAFTRKYWEMVESTPEVLVDHVKLWRMLGAEEADQPPPKA